MGLLVNNNDYNLATLAGYVSNLTLGHRLPYDLYVFGTQGREATVYIDPKIPDCEQIVSFLTKKGINAVNEMPYRPEFRPAVALSRGMRDDENIKLAAQVCAFILFCLHETIVLNAKDLNGLFVSIA